MFAVSHGIKLQAQPCRQAAAEQLEPCEERNKLVHTRLRGNFPVFRCAAPQRLARPVHGRSLSVHFACWLLPHTQLRSIARTFCCNLQCCPAGLAVWPHFVLLLWVLQQCLCCCCAGEHCQRVFIIYPLHCSGCAVPHKLQQELLYMAGFDCTVQPIDFHNVGLVWYSCAHMQATREQAGQMINHSHCMICHCLQAVDAYVCCVHFDALRKHAATAAGISDQHGRMD